MSLPPPIVETRLSACNGCTCTVDIADPCASCPNNRWTKIFCHDHDPVHAPIRLTPPAPLPTTAEMAASLVRSTVQWAKSGFAHTPEPELQQRLDTCKSCEFWDATGFGGTGRCNKCGCSTWAKLRMATSKCPVGKWPSTSSGRGPSASSGSGTGLQ